MIDPNELIATCYKLMPPTATPPPSQADLRRAISAAYYAVFHTLAAPNAELVAGQPKSSMSSYAWERVLPPLGPRQSAEQSPGGSEPTVPTRRNFARAFIDLQDSRHRADYNPNAPIDISLTVNIIARAETVIGDFARLPEEERRLFAAQSMFDRR